jgi:membrane-associated phospholipid phosphatase
VLQSFPNLSSPLLQTEPIREIGVLAWKAVEMAMLELRGRWRLTCPLAVAAALAAPHGAWAKTSAWTTVGNVGEGGLMALALGKSVAERDWTGTGQLALDLGVTEGATEILKATVRERRPDGSDYQSFPSGHASLSFAAAGYLQKRYGWQWGLPATAVAAVVGLSRVESKSHHWYDVVAGAALGEASAYFLTSPRNPNVHWLPWAGADGGDIAVVARF